MSQYEDKLKKVQRLLKTKEKIESELKALLSPAATGTLPRGFSMNEEVLRLVRESGKDGISVQEILTAINTRYPNSATQKRIASALAYLKNTKKHVTQIGRGVYVIVENKTS